MFFLPSTTPIPFSHTTGRANVDRMKGAATRDLIVAEALRQVTLSGFNGLSLGPLAGSLGLSKSGLFAHFKSKETLQIEVFKEASERFRTTVLEPALTHPDAEERLSGLLANWLAWLRGSPDNGGCFFLAIAQEADDQPGAIRDLLVGSQCEWRKLLASVVQDGIAQGVFNASADTQQVAFEIIGAGQAYQHAFRLLGDAQARARVQEMLDRIVASIRIRAEEPVT